MDKDIVKMMEDGLTENPTGWFFAVCNSGRSRGSNFPSLKDFYGSLGLYFSQPHTTIQHLRLFEPQFLLSIVSAANTSLYAIKQQVQDLHKRKDFLNQCPFTRWAREAGFPKEMNEAYNTDDFDIIPEEIRAHALQFPTTVLKACYRNPTDYTAIEEYFYKQGLNVIASARKRDGQVLPEDLALDLVSRSGEKKTLKDLLNQTPHNLGKIPLAVRKAILTKSSVPENKRPADLVQLQTPKKPKNSAG